MGLKENIIENLTVISQLSKEVEVLKTKEQELLMKIKDKKLSLMTDLGVNESTTKTIGVVELAKRRLADFILEEYTEDVV